MQAEHPIVLQISLGQPGLPDSMTPILLLIVDMLNQASLWWIAKGVSNLSHISNQRPMQGLSKLHNI